ncbi:protein HIR2 [Suhomyces tanzawaensis NRRL Y-17324]|uniref:Protein HIR n=1 Tax=Suhomyces tanzawaensis NRRL Y-17324 TaxID=984487 RepID=A0A1E4SGK9_9ASCO|nr:protein HIR2 [Suhomyces tanzawaensis NRRL Y-17324]ODV78638.1 protein HIR2 [Suhomyces tanzawaensis NRRL Y-17324]
MRFLKLPSVLHGGQIHAVDINSDNTKVATAGKDGLVLVWSMAQLDQAASAEQGQGALVQGVGPLETHHNHALVVSVVRWSPSDPSQYVSGDSEGSVYLGARKLFPFPAQDPGGVSAVIDLSWSHDGRLVAWSTADGKTLLIDVANNTFQELSRLQHLDTPVIQRSVLFDPTNNYLITLGDDTLIYLYQYAYENGQYSFRLINKISRLINKNPLNVHYKRISWSPDGELVSIPTASKNQTALISLISRSKNWQNRISLVGHGLTCEVVKFNPKIFNSSETDNDNIYNVLATAGSDRTLAVWNTSKDTPIFLLQEIVDHPITDVCWDRTGTTLFISSLDGYLGIISFEKNELGYQVSQEVVSELAKFEKEFVKPLNHKYETEQPTGRRGNANQIELVEQKNSTDMLAPVITESKEEVKDAAVAEPVVKQELKKKGAIIPEVLAPPDMNEPEPQTNDDILQSAMTERLSKQPVAKPKTITTAGKEKEKIEKEKEKLEKQKITTKNGKKRIQPMLISNGGSKEDTKVESSSNGTKISTNNSSKSLIEFDKPSYSVSERFYKDNKRSKQDDGSTTKKFKRELEPIKYIGSPILNPNTSFAKVRLAVPKVRLGFQITSKSDEDTFVLDIKNGSGNETKPSRITYFKKDKQVWCDFIPRYIHLATEGSLFWALSSSDGQILTYTHASGKRLLPPLVLGSPISFLESHTNYLMAVTSIGELYVWNLEIKKVVLTTNLAPLLELSNKYQEDGLSKSDNITMCAITSSGIPLVTLSNGSGYLYNKDLGIWQTITESWWSFGSHFWDSSEENSTKSSSSSLFSEETSIIELLEQKTNEEIIRKTRTGRGKYFNKISKNMIMKEGFENLENTISISHLENKILCCELLGENKDFHKYFITYVKRICELGFKAKLFEVCNHLLGPQSDEDEENEVDTKWDPMVCGLKKHDLLKEVILACAQSRDAQRILIHFGNKIGLVEDPQPI